MDNLVDDLGGTEALDQIVEDFYIRVQNDPHLVPIFASVHIDKLVGMQQEFLATALSGTGEKSSTSLQAIHAGRGITPQHFSHFVDHFIAVLEDRYVPNETITAVAQRLGLYLDDVVGGTNEAG